MEEKDYKKIVEINGIKIEVDLRTAKKIDTFKVGDPVKIMVQKYENQCDVLPGVIVGFSEFQSSPAIEVLALKQSYTTVDIEFYTINAKTKNAEICACNHYERLFSKEMVSETFDKMIHSKELEVDSLKNKKRFFETKFANVFGELSFGKAENL